MYIFYLCVAYFEFKLYTATHILINYALQSGKEKANFIVMISDINAVQIYQRAQRVRCFVYLYSATSIL